MKRLDRWPDHKLTFGFAVVPLAIFTLLHASDGHLDWLFYASLIATVGAVVIGVREKRRARLE